MRQSDGSLRLIERVGLPAAYHEYSQSVAHGGASIYDHVASKREALYIDAIDDLFPEQKEQFALVAAESAALLPLVVGQQFIGVITLCTAYSYSWYDSDRQYLEQIANLSAVALSRTLLVTLQAYQHQRSEQVLTSISHELRTPLTSIQGYLELVQRKLRHTSSRPRVAHYVATALSQTHHLSETIEQLLDTALIDYGNLTLQPSEVQPGHFFETSCKELRQRFSQRLIAVHIPDAPKKAFWDKDRVFKILYHLIKNATMYSRLPAPIEMLVRYDEPGVQVSVHDYGQGIAQEKQEKIFDRFWRGVDNSFSKQSYGLGLGLFLSRAFAQAHGGRIHVQSSGISGEGSTFTLILPWHVSSSSSASF